MAKEHEEAEPIKRKGEMPRADEEVTGEQLVTSELREESGAGGPLCRDVMKEAVVSVDESDSVYHAARAMRDTGVGFLPVCDSAGKVVGTITDRDITIRVSAERREVDACRVGEVMTEEVVACGPEDTLEHAEGLMSRYHKSRILVTDDEDRLVGVISLSDIATHDDSQRAGETLLGVAQREAQP